jgi:hypothetical protein
MGGSGGSGGTGGCGSGGGGGPAINIAFDTASSPVQTVVSFVDGTAGPNGDDCNGNPSSLAGMQKETYAIAEVQSQ